MRCSKLSFQHSSVYKIKNLINSWSFFTMVRHCCVLCKKTVSINFYTFPFRRTFIKKNWSLLFSQNYFRNIVWISIHVYTYNIKLNQINVILGMLFKIWDIVFILALKNLMNAIIQLKTKIPFKIFHIF